MREDLQVTKVVVFHRQERGQKLLDSVARGVVMRLHRARPRVPTLLARRDVLAELPPADDVVRLEQHKVPERLHPNA